VDIDKEDLVISRAGTAVDEDPGQGLRAGPASIRPSPSAPTGRRPSSRHRLADDVFYFDNPFFGSGSARC
jgi:hypothetical protein